MTNLIFHVLLFLKSSIFKITLTHLITMDDFFAYGFLKMLSGNELL